jgi:hypothetical protein
VEPGATLVVAEAANRAEGQRRAFAALTGLPVAGAPVAAHVSPAITPAPLSPASAARPARARGTQPSPRTASSHQRREAVKPFGPDFFGLH